MSVISCSIVSPEGELFSGVVEMLIADGGAGGTMSAPGVASAHGSLGVAPGSSNGSPMAAGESPAGVYGRDGAVAL